MYSVVQSSVVVRLSASFPFVPNYRYSIRFTHNAWPFAVMRQVI